jgi:protein-S-isoprenylcysteine O-methyltransferase Ste14
VEINKIALVATKQVAKEATAGGGRVVLRTGQYAMRHPFYFTGHLLATMAFVNMATSVGYAVVEVFLETLDTNSVQAEQLQMSHQNPGYTFDEYSPEEIQRK